MFNRKYILSFLLILFILFSAISISSAADFTDIQDAIDNANENDTIELNGTYIGNGEVIHVNKSGLKFVGKNSTIIDGNNLSSIFNVSSNGVEFNNINFINANGVRGGAIYTSGTSTYIEECNFTNCNSTWGAGVFFEGIGGTVTNSNFKNNHATYGVSIYVNAENTSVFYSNFINNTAINCAPGIFGNASNLYVVGSNFIDNHAGYTGGGITLNNGENDSILGCTFINNFGSLGGAINYGTPNGIVYMCSFINNSADMGGAILWRSPNGTVENSIFDGNKAELGNTFTKGKDVDVSLNKDYWAVNASTAREFKKYKFVTYYDTYDNGTMFEVAYAPNSWVLMSIYNDSEVIYGKTAKFSVALDTLTDGKEFVEMEGNLPDYTTSISINNKKPILLTIPFDGIAQFVVKVDSLYLNIVAKSPITGLEESSLFIKSLIENNESNNTKTNLKLESNGISMENTGSSLFLLIISLLSLPILKRKI